MKQRIAKLWTAKLRSGEYKQGHRMLRTNDGRFCCLGVLCELAGEKKVIPEWDGAYDNQKAVLPEKVRVWAGMKTHTGLIRGYFELSALNDNHMSFEVLADRIDTYVKVL